MYLLSYYIPQNDHERVKQALFACGAGKIGHYDKCCWAVLGDGQFRAREGSNPGIGQVGKLQQLAEYKVEMVCADEQIREVLATLLTEHPYEQPAYFVSQVMTLDDL
ncbi:MAG: NGG1p interacting factor NIF3 [Gammaproteobacteria bacterium]|nr:NGG1p interacting factor NIF3 [Gammaproteobacteria bacterium]